MYYKAQVTEVDGNGRAKVQFLSMPNITTDWIHCMTGVYGSGSEGQHSTLGIGDVVIVSHFDEMKQQFFILGKLQSSNTRIEVEDKTKFYFNGHTVEFNDSGIDIENSSGSYVSVGGSSIDIENSSGSYVSVLDNSIEISTPIGTSQIVYNGLDLITWLLTLLGVGGSSTIIGNLGYPVVEATQLPLLSAAKALMTKVEIK